MAIACACVVAEKSVTSWPQVTGSPFCGSAKRSRLTPQSLSHELSLLLTPSLSVSPSLLFSLPLAPLVSSTDSPARVVPCQEERRQIAMP